MRNIKYRKANIDDSIELSKLRWFFRKNNDSYDERFIENCSDFIKSGIQKNEWTIWIAEESKKIIAHIFIRKIAKLPGPDVKYLHFGYVANVYVKEAYRNMGIGSKLMKKVLVWAKKEKYELLVAWRSKESKNFYLKNGFNTNIEIMEKNYED